MKTCQGKEAREKKEYYDLVGRERTKRGNEEEKRRKTKAEVNKGPSTPGTVTINIQFLK